MKVGTGIEKSKGEFSTSKLTFFLKNGQTKSLALFEFWIYKSEIEFVLLCND